MFLLWPIKEQQQLCAALQETKTLLEEQLADARERCSSVRELERDNLLLRQRIMDVEAERDTERQRVDELLEMNMSLEADLRHAITSRDDVPAPAAVIHQRFLRAELDSDEELSELTDHKPLSVEVGEASTLRLLGAEQKNADLRRRLEELQAHQEVNSPDAKDELSCLEMEHQNTLREFQNLKNENVTLKQRLEELLTQLQHLRESGKAGDIKKLAREDEEIVRGVQGCESCRIEGQGWVRLMEDREKTGEVIGSQREAGVGEEGLHAQEGRCKPCEIEIQAKRRGEAEGGQKERHKWDKDGEPKEEQAVMTAGSEIPKPPTEDYVEVKDTNSAVCALSGPDVELLTKQLQEAQEEVDRQVELGQNLRSKLAKQRRHGRQSRSWSSRSLSCSA
ncbi:hypothetical protein OJAV_G00102790 [Oryzias javanicus]|uniref:Uncharacterized protein n=1 Tax=Oryzias javanicus TaxID=123683 RepID=A0A437CXY3_ORYJA|nr:hypothetical protein OJAV_G00102790 [Oryzias javanicus]